MPHYLIKNGIIVFVTSSIMTLSHPIFAAEKNMVDNPFEYSQYPTHIQQEIHDFQQMMSRFTTVFKVQEDANYYLKQMLKRQNIEQLLQSNNITLNSEAIATVKRQSEKLLKQRQRLDLAMKTAICSEFANQVKSQVDAMKIIEIIEQADEKLDEAEQVAIKALTDNLSALTKLQIENVSPITTRVKTDYRAMAEQEPEFFINLVHEQCLKPAHLETQSDHFP